MSPETDSERDRTRAAASAERKTAVRFLKESSGAGRFAREQNQDTRKEGEGQHQSSYGASLGWGREGVDGVERPLHSVGRGKGWREGKVTGLGPIFQEIQLMYIGGIMPRKKRETRDVEEPHDGLMLGSGAPAPSLGEGKGGGASKALAPDESDRIAKKNKKKRTREVSRQVYYPRIRPEKRGTEKEEVRRTTRTMMARGMQIRGHVKGKLRASKPRKRGSESTRIREERR